VLAAFATTGCFFGMVGLINILIYRVNLFVFWREQSSSEVSKPACAKCCGNLFASGTGDKEPPLRQDWRNHNFFKSAKNKPTSEWENELLYCLTFGGIKKFGIRTKHFYQYFAEDSNDAEELRVLKQEARRFMSSARIRQKVKSGGRKDSSKLRIDSKQALNPMAGDSAKGSAYESMKIIMPTEDESNSTNELDQDLLKELKNAGNKKDYNQTKSEVYTSLMLYELENEIMRIRHIITNEMQDDVKQAKLGRALRLGKKSELRLYSDVNENNDRKEA